MKVIKELVKRNMLIYARDKAGVLFSLLSMFITLALMAVFLGNMNCEELLKLLEQFGASPDTIMKDNVTYLIQMWTIAGILVINSVTITLTMIGIMVQDDSGKKLASFYVAPISRMKIIVGYIVSAVIVGFFMCVLTLFISELYIIITGGALLSAIKIFKILGVIFVNVFMSACLMFLIALFVHSNSAWNGIATISGTLIGFIGGTYLPMGMLPESIQNVLKCLPFLHGTAMMRQVCTEDVIAKTFYDFPTEAGTGYQEFMGITVKIKDRMMSINMQIAFLIICGIIALGISAFIIKKRAVSEQ